MFVEPAETVVLLPSRTRYEQRGGGTETSTERRDHLQPGDSRTALPATPATNGRFRCWWPASHESRAGRTGRSPGRTPRTFATKSIASAPPIRESPNCDKKGDSFQYGGRRLLVDRCLTPDGKGHFSVVELPEENVPHGPIPAVHAPRQAVQQHHASPTWIPSPARSRDDILMSAEDAARLGLQNGDAITLRNELGQFRGRVRIDRIKPGCLQAHWPEANVIIPAGRLDPSGVPDYNATVDLVGGNSPGG